MAKQAQKPDKKTKRQEVSQENPVIYFFGEVNNDNAKDFMRELSAADSLGKMITVIVNSPGGDVDAAIACYDCIKSTRNTVLTVGSGLVASAAILVFLAGDVRLMYSNARMFFHEVRVDKNGENGYTTGELTRLAKETADVASYYFQLVSDCSGMSPGTVEAMCKQETYVKVHEAVKLGLATSEYAHSEMKHLNNSTPLERAVIDLIKKD